MSLSTRRQDSMEIEGEKSGFPLFCDNGTLRHSTEQDDQLCRICFATDGILLSMKTDKNLEKGYRILTGLSIENEDNIPPYVCKECSQQLLHCIHFRNRALRAHLHLLEIVRKYDCISLKTIKTTDGGEAEPVHVKKENIDTDEVCFENVTGELEDFVNGIKKEDEYTSSEDSPRNDAASSSYLNEDAVLDILKTEKGDVYIDHGIIGGDVTSNVMVHVTFRDENRSDEHNSIEGAKQKMKLDIGKKVTKKKTSKNLKQSTGDVLLLYDNLCCDICPYRTSSDVQFLSHVKEHKSTKSFKCNYETNIRQKLNTNGVRFFCHVCKKTFSTKWGRQKHMKTHFAEKQYVCDVCNKGFNENRDLQNHLRTHSGEKPYECDLCKKAFSERGNLLRHIRIHAGEKPFLCKICKMSFNQKHHLKRHLTKHFKRI